MTESNSRKPRTRSPSYPAISLPAAIARADVVYKRERQHPFPVSGLPRVWGYKSLNGPASTTLAALIKYGLVEDEGSGDDRTARISDLSVEILASPYEDARRRAIQSAALMPPIHQEMWDRYRTELPSDDGLIWELTRQRSFTETGAREFVREYRETLAFADLSEEVGASANVDAPSSPAGQDTETPRTGDMFADLFPPSRPASIHSDSAPSPALAMQHKPEADHRDTYKVPVSQGRSVDIVGAFPISEQDWVLFMTVLAAMKPGLVLPDAEAV